MKIFAVIDEAPRFIDIFASEIFSSAEKVKQLVALSLIQDQSRRSMQPASFTFTFRLLPSRHT